MAFKSTGTAYAPLGGKPGMNQLVDSTSVRLTERVGVTGGEFNDRAGEIAQQEYIEKFEAVRPWYMALGLITLVSALVFIIVVPVLGHHYTVAIRVNLYTIVQAWTYDLSFIIFSGGLLVGLLYGAVAVPQFWNLVKGNTLTGGVNSYAHAIDAIQDVFLMITLAQIVGITDIFTIVLIAMARIAASVLNYSMDYDNSDAMMFPDGVRVWHNGLFSLFVLVAGAWLPILTYMVTYYQYVRTLDPLLFTDYYRFWVILTLPCVGAAFDIVFNTLLGWFRYSNRNIDAANIDAVNYNFITTAFVHDPSRYDVTKALTRFSMYALTMICIFVIALDGH